MNLIGDLIYDSALNGYADSSPLIRAIKELIQLERALSEDLMHQTYRSTEPLDSREDLRQEIAELRRKIGL